jgi:geranylgeranyl pyrophosphate synthase
MIALSLFLKNIAGFIWLHWRIFAVIGATALLFLLVMFGVRSCRKEPKLDQKEIIEAQQAIRENDRKEMIEILAESDVREQGIDNSIKLAEEATEKAKQNYTGKSNADLAAELERRLSE